MKGDRTLKAVVVKQKSVRGFLPTTYAVFAGDRLVKLFLSRLDAETCAEEWNRDHEVLH